MKHLIIEVYIAREQESKRDKDKEKEKEMKEFQMHFDLDWPNKPCESCPYCDCLTKSSPYRYCKATWDWYGVLEEDAACYKMQYPPKRRLIDEEAKG